MSTGGHKNENVLAQTFTPYSSIQLRRLNQNRRLPRCENSKTRQRYGLQRDVGGNENFSAKDENQTGAMFSRPSSIQVPS